MLLGPWRAAWIAGALAAAGTAVPAVGQAPVTVAAFLARTSALKAKGFAALFSPELKALRDLGAAAGAEYRARLAQERAAGRPSSCPPAKVKIGSDQFLAHLESYPAPARERTTLSMAVADLFVRTWPCR
ncbi:hypothetical protein [Novosphingobium piscinae]|uniref:hypothetical protein n=1 Tax=Novosphingobium piscinae TaxID=1507448 RepID=UPI0031B6411D